MSEVTIIRWGETAVDPAVFSRILDFATDHRPWYHDNVWNAGPDVRRSVASQHLSDALTAGRVWEAWRGAELLGIFVLNQVRPGLDAQAHFLFFDRQLANKRQLCRAMIQRTFADEELALHALRVDLPEYVGKYAHFLRKGLGFKYEAERRLSNPKAAARASRRYQAAFYDGKWCDVLLLSLTREEFLAWSQHEQGGRQHRSDSGTDTGRHVLPEQSVSESSTTPATVSSEKPPESSD